MPNVQVHAARGSWRPWAPVSIHLTEWLELELESTDEEIFQKSCCSFFRQHGRGVISGGRTYRDLTGAKELEVQVIIDDIGNDWT